jgi:hypothetical protein
MVLDKLMLIENHSYDGICTSSDTSRLPPMSRNGHDLVTTTAASIESASMMVKPDILVPVPIETLPSGDT